MLKPWCSYEPTKSGGNVTLTAIAMYHLSGGHSQVVYPRPSAREKGAWVPDRRLCLLPPQHMAERRGHGSTSAGPPSSTDPRGARSRVLNSRHRGARLDPTELRATRTLRGARLGARGRDGEFGGFRLSGVSGCNLSGDRDLEWCVRMRQSIILPFILIIGHLG